MPSPGRAEEHGRPPLQIQNSRHEIAARAFPEVEPSPVARLVSQERQERIAPAHHGDLAPPAVFDWSAVFVQRLDVEIVRQDVVSGRILGRR
jgi:hypothetical protein